MKNTTRAFLCCGGSVVNIGFSFLSMNLVGLFCVPLASKLGVEYSQLAIIWTTLTFGSIIGRYFAGQLFDKFNPKVLCAGGAISYLLALVCLIFIKSTTTAYILFFFVGITNVFAGTLPFQLLGSKWIGIGRGTIIGMTAIFSAIFDMIFAPIVASYATKYGFEKTAIISGIILFVCHVAVSLICISREPSAYGMEPVDLKFLEGKDKKSATANEIYETKMPIRKIMKLPVFWVLMFIPLLISLAQQSFYSNRAGVFNSMGLDLTQVAFLVGLYSIGNCILVWGFGFLCDKIGFRKTILGYASIGAILWFAWPGLKSMLFVGGLIITFFANVSQINNYFGPNVMIPLFGLNKSNKLISWSTMIAAAGGMIAPLIVSLVSSYDTIFLMAASIYVVVFMLTLVATKPSSIAKIKEEDKVYMEENNIIA